MAGLRRTIRDWFTWDSVPPTIVPATVRISATAIVSIAVIVVVAALRTLVVVQLVSLFALVLPERPAIPKIPPLVALVLLQITFFVALMMVKSGIMIIVIA